MTHFIEILSHHFIIEIKSIPKKETVILENEVDEGKEASIITFKEFCMDHLSRVKYILFFLRLISEKVRVYMYQILFKLLILYFHFENTEMKQKESEKNQNQEKKVVNKDGSNKMLIKDITKLIDLFRIKVDSEEEDSDIFFLDIIKVKIK